MGWGVHQKITCVTHDPWYVSWVNLKRGKITSKRGKITQFNPRAAGRRRAPPKVQCTRSKKIIHAGTQGGTRSDLHSLVSHNWWLARTHTVVTCQLITLIDRYQGPTLVRRAMHSFSLNYLSTNQSPKSSQVSLFTMSCPRCLCLGWKPNGYPPTYITY